MAEIKYAPSIGEPGPPRIAPIVRLEFGEQHWSYGMRAPPTQLENYLRLHAARFNDRERLAAGQSICNGLIERDGKNRFGRCLKQTGSG